MNISLPPINWLSVLPCLVLTATGILVLFWYLWMQEEERALLAWLGLIGLLITGVVSFMLWGRNESAFNGTLALDSYALFFNLIFCLAAGLTLLMSVHYLETVDIRPGEYYALILFATVGMVLMAAATDLIVIFLGLETMSIAVYVLAGIWRQRLQSNEAALKYFLLGAFASGFFLYGVALVYGVTGSVQLGKIAAQVSTHGSSPLLLVGVALLIVGFGFKIAAAPFHVWTPDVYEGAPTTVTAFMAVGVKAAAFAAFARVFVAGLGRVAASWTGLLWVLAALTMTVGNVTAVRQRSVKRMLAYSSIAHAGYALVGLVAGGRDGGAALLFYLAVYSFMTLGAFAVLIALGRRGAPNEGLSGWGGGGFRPAVLGRLMAGFLFSLAGCAAAGGGAGECCR